MILGLRLICPQANEFTVIEAVTEHTCKLTRVREAGEGSLRNTIYIWKTVLQQFKTATRILLNSQTDFSAVNASVNWNHGPPTPGT